MQIEFWFDLACPYAYLASTQIGRCALHAEASELLYRPVRLADLKRLTGAPDETFPEAKQRALREDLVRWAAWYGVPFNPDAAPGDTGLALRMLLAARERCTGLVDGLYRAAWVDGADLGDEAVLRREADAADLDGGRLLDLARAEATEEHLRHLGEEATGRGVFGVPSIIVGDEVFWGQDRLHFVEMALAGWRTSAEEATR